MEPTVSSLSFLCVCVCVSFLPFIHIFLYPSPTSLRFLRARARARVRRRSFSSFDDLTSLFVLEPAFVLFELFLPFDFGSVAGDTYHIKHDRIVDIPQVSLVFSSNYIKRGSFLFKDYFDRLPYLYFELTVALVCW